MSTVCEHDNVNIYVMQHRSQENTPNCEAECEVERLCSRDTCKGRGRVEPDSHVVQLSSGGQHCGQGCIGFVVLVHEVVVPAALVVPGLVPVSLSSSIVVVVGMLDLSQA
eukprot:3790403-Amphidinium_carterae.2